MLLKRLTRLHERGDTIVEVLISIAILSLILGGAFVTTNNSLEGTRAAQERGNALKLIESQIEQVKNLAVTNSDTIFGSSTPASFCISNTGTVAASTSASCAVGTDGNPTAVEPVYHIAITRSGNTFTFLNVWNNIRGGSQENLQMVYKVYQK